MSKAGALRADAARMRDLMAAHTDPVVVAELQSLINELEHRARVYGNGDGADELAADS